MDKPTPRLIGWQLALDRAPQFLSVILLFAVPFLTQPKGMDPMLPKATMTQALVFLMAGLWALRTYATGRLVLAHSKAMMVLGLLALWVVMILPLSPYPVASHAGLRDLAPFFLWYFLLHLTCTEAWRGENLLVVFLLSGLGTGLWAIGQRMGWAEGPWLDLVHERFGGRPVAGLGDPDSLAGFLLLVWPLGLGLMVRSSNGWARAFWGLVTASGLSALFLTGSAPGWAGSLVAAAVFGLVLLKRKEKRTLLWVIGICLFLAASFLLPPLQERVKGLGDPGSVWPRQEAWSGAVNIFREHPLEGTGPGTFWAAYPSHAPYSSRMREEPPKVQRPQNWALEWAAGTGLIGFLLLLAFWGLVTAQWWKLFSAHAIPAPLAAGAFGALAGVAVEGFFHQGPCLPVALLPLLFLAVLPVPLSQRFIRIPGFPIQEKVLDLSGAKPYLLPVLALVVAGCLWQVKDAFERQGADVLGAKAASLSADGKWDEAFGLYTSALRSNALNLPLLRARSEAHRTRNAPGDGEAALVDLDILLRAVPDDGSLHWAKYEVLSRLDRRGEAAGELKKAVLAQPWRIRGTEGFRKALDLMGRGKNKEALDLYMRLVMEYPFCAPLMVDYAKSLASVGRVSDARSVLREVLALDLGNEDARATMELIAKENDKAI